MAALDLPITTERLVLRPFRREDCEALARYYTLPDVQRYLDIKARSADDAVGALAVLREQVGWQRPGDLLMLAMERRVDGEVIGHACLRWSDATARQGEVRCVLNPAHRSQGFATEALRAMIDTAFEKLELHRIFARCDGREAAPARLLQGLGLRLEAHYREHALYQGEWDEELHFAVLDREWRRANRLGAWPPAQVA